MKIKEFKNDKLELENNKGHNVFIYFDENKNEIVLYCYDTEKYHTIKTCKE